MPTVDPTCATTNPPEPFWSHYNEAAFTQQQEDFPTFYNDVNITPPTTCLNIRLSYELVEDTDVSIMLYDLQGRPICEIMPSTPQSSGRQSLYFDGSDLKGGIYLCAIRVGDKVFTQKVVKID